MLDGADTVTTIAGKLSAEQNDEDENSLPRILLDDKPVYTFQDHYGLSFKALFDMAGSYQGILIIATNYAHPPCPVDLYLMTLNPDQSVKVSDPFGTCTDYLKYEIDTIKQAVIMKNASHVDRRFQEVEPVGGHEYSYWIYQDKEVRELEGWNEDESVAGDESEGEYDSVDRSLFQMLGMKFPLTVSDFVDRMGEPDKMEYDEDDPSPWGQFFYWPIPDQNLMLTVLGSGSGLEPQYDESCIFLTLKSLESDDGGTVRHLPSNVDFGDSYGVVNQALLHLVELNPKLELSGGIESQLMLTDGESYLFYFFDDDGGLKEVMLSGININQAD